MQHIITVEGRSQIFIELLRRGGMDATKEACEPKSCRMNKENGAPLSPLLTLNLML